MQVEKYSSSVFISSGFAHYLTIIAVFTYYLHTYTQYYSPSSHQHQQQHHLILSTAGSRRIPDLRPRQGGPMRLASVGVGRKAAALSSAGLACRRSGCAANLTSSSIIIKSSRGIGKAGQGRMAQTHAPPPILRDCSNCDRRICR